MSALSGSVERDPLEIAETWLREGRKAALATVVETWGSAPRPVGSHLVIDAEGNFEGSVSGGCVEGAVVTEAESVIADGKPRLLEFGVADETAWGVGLSCGGRISVLVQTLDPAKEGAGKLVSPINEARRNRRPVALATDFESGRSHAIEEKDASDPAIAERLANGTSGPLDLPSGRTMVSVYLPAPRLVLIGAVHISQALAPMATVAGFDVSIVDPRQAFATAERFAGIRYFPEWPQDVLPRLGLDQFTAFAALTHDPKIDDPGLEAAFAADCFYVGALGSRKTHAKRLDRMRAKGIDERRLATIHAPIGLPIGARTPAEIAVAILGEIIAAKASRATTVEAAA